MEQQIKQQMREFIRDFEAAFVVIVSESEEATELMFDLNKRADMLAWYQKHNFFISLMLGVSCGDVVFTGNDARDNHIALHFYALGTNTCAKFKHQMGMRPSATRMTERKANA